MSFTGEGTIGGDMNTAVCFLISLVVFFKFRGALYCAIFTFPTACHGMVISIPNQKYKKTTEEENDSEVGILAKL